MRRLDVVIGQRILQLFWVHLGFLNAGGKVLLIHKKSSQETGMDRLKLNCPVTYFNKIARSLKFYFTWQNLQMTSNPFVSCWMRAQISANCNKNNIIKTFPSPSLIKSQIKVVVCFDFICALFSYLDNAENFIIAEVLPLTVDQEVV